MGLLIFPQLIRATVKASQDHGIPISIYDFQDVLEHSAYYSQVKESPMGVSGIVSEIAAASRFLNPEGVSCYECDGARELAMPLYTKTMPEDYQEQGIQITPRNVFARREGAMELGERDLHADFAIEDQKHGQRFIMDTTPRTRDPRDPAPPEGGAAPISRAENPPKAIFSPSVKPPPPRHEGSKTTFPLEEVARNLAEIRSSADYRRVRPEDPLSVKRKALVTGADGKENAPAEQPKSGIRKPGRDEVMTPDGKLLGRWEVDSSVEVKELERHLDKARAIFAEAKLIPKTVDRGPALIPSVVLLEAGRLIVRRLRGEISQAEFEHKAAQYVPSDFVWPDVSLRGKIEAFANVLEKQQSKKLKFAEEQLARKTLAQPALADPRVKSVVQNTFKWIAAQDWIEPRYVANSPASCDKKFALVRK